MKFKFVILLAAFAIAGRAFADPVSMPGIKKSGSYGMADGVVCLDSTGADATDTAAHACKTILVNHQGLPAGSNSYTAALATTTGFYATPTDLFSIQNPIASRTVVYIRFVGLLVNSTSATVGTYYWYRRVSLDTGGSPTAITAAKTSSANPNPVAVVQFYTAAPTINDNSPAFFGKTTASTTATGSVPGLVATTLTGPQITTVVNDAIQVISLQPGEEFDLNFNGAALPAAYAGAPIVEWAEVPQ